VARWRPERPAAREPRQAVGTPEPDGALTTRTAAAVDERTAESWTPQDVLSLQHAVGNGALARLIAGGGAGAPVSLQRQPAPPDSSGSDYLDARNAKERWQGEGVRGPMKHTRGGFQVAYVPMGATGALNITLKGGVDFEDGIELRDLYGFKFAVNNQGTAQVQAAANAINSLPLGQREAAVADWRWAEAEKKTFLHDFEKAIEDAWHRQYQFHCTKEHWTDLGVDVNVFVEVHEGARVGDEHMQVTNYKIAPGATAGGIGVVRRTGSGPDDVEMRLNSVDARPRTDILLKTSASFDPGGDVLDAAGKRSAQIFGGWWAGGGAPICPACSEEITELASSPINLHVQGSGPDPETQANARFTNVVGDLLAGGMSDAVARCKFHYDGEGDGVRFVVGNGEPQIVAAHEAGHMFGLDDEYQKSSAPKGTPGDPLAIGAAVDPGLAQAQGLPGAVRERSDSIMSVGNAVKPQHYATFLAALKLVTGMEDWEFGPAPGAVPPGVDGPVRRPGQKDPMEPKTAIA
jgi:hypothetical protein